MDVGEIIIRVDVSLDRCAERVLEELEGDMVEVAWYVCEV